MSYDYLLYRSPRLSLIGLAMGLFAGQLGKVMALTQSLDGPAIGPVDDVKARISRALPAVQWNKGGALPLGLALPKSDINWNWRTSGAPEIMLGTDPEGNVRLISISRAEPHEVKSVARTLKLRVIDEQAFDL
jgi:hypothetical protein